MTIQDKIEKRTITLRRKLADKNQSLVGTSAECLRLRIDTDEFGDEENIEVLLQDTINIKIVFPAEIPLFRFRSYTASTAQDITIESNTGVYLFDILPIEIFTQFKDRVEVGDFLIYKTLDENNKALYLVLQATEPIGVFRKTLLWKKFNSAIYTGQYDIQINQILSNLDSNEEL